MTPRRPEDAPPNSPCQPKPTNMMRVDIGAESAAVDIGRRSMLTIRVMPTLRIRGPLQLCRHLMSGVLLFTMALSPALGAQSKQTPSERVRVPTSYANVHAGPSSGQVVLVLVPRGTVLTVLARDKEWIQVQLTPELRKTGMVMRWYKNEDRGWMHDSTVEVLKAAPR